MNPNEIDQVVIALRRAVPGYAKWCHEGLDQLARQNGTLLGEERIEHARIWQRQMATIRFEDAIAAVRDIEAGYDQTPYFGQMPAHVRRLAMQRRDRLLRERALAKERQDNASRRAAVALGQPVKVLDEFQAALAAQQPPGVNDV